MLSSPLTTSTTLPKALEIYSRIRLPIAYQMLDRSRKNGWICAFYDPKNPLSDSSDWNLEEMAQKLLKNNEWQVELPHPEEERVMAVRMLEEELR